MTKLIIILILVAAYVSLAEPASYSSPCQISDSDAIRTIMGEAAGEPYRGKLAYACVLRNRNKLQGSYGANRTKNWLNKQPKYAWDAAARAWNESLTNNIVGDCNLAGGKIDDHYFQINLHLKPRLSVANQRFYKY